MGFVFIESLEGSRVFICSNCEVPLADDKERADKRPGTAAILFRKVVNVFGVPKKEVQILTQRCIVEHVFCCDCCQLKGFRLVRAYNGTYRNIGGMYVFYLSKLIQVEKSDSESSSE